MATGSGMNSKESFTFILDSSIVNLSRALKPLLFSCYTICITCACSHTHRYTYTSNVIHKKAPYDNPLLFTGIVSVQE